MFMIGPLVNAVVVFIAGIVGSVVIMIIALNLMGITRIRAANCIPSVFLPLIACLIYA